MLFELIHDVRNGRGFLTDGHVDTLNAFAFLVDNRVDRNRGFANLTIANN